MKKKILCLFLIITTLFLFVVNVDAGASEDAIEATEKYCLEGEHSGGCIYKESETIYTQSGKYRNENVLWYYTVDGVALTRGYQAANKDGRMVFAGCYKTNDGFFFKMIEPDGDTCKVTAHDFVPNDGFESPKGFGNLWISTKYDGKTPLGADSLTLVAWKAKSGGQCPLYFGYTANTRWYTSDANTFVFGDSGSGFDLMTWSFWHGEKYDTNPGCTEMNQAAHDEAEECFDNAKTKIENKTCPTDLTKLSELASELEKYQEECKSQFETLHSKGLLERDAEEFSTKLKEAAEKKIDECYYGRCNITSAEQVKIETEQRKSANSACKDGCSDSTNTTCMDCLKKVYKDAGINDTKTACMLSIEEEKEQTEDKVDEDIDTQFDEEVQETLEENKQQMENMANFEFQATLPEFGFGEEGSNCSDILGANLTKIVNLGITAVRIAGAIIAIVNGMITLIPPLVSKDADALKKAGNKCIRLGIVLLVIGVFPTLVRVIGRLFGYDLSCLL